jgi:hypothetical protein
MHEVSAVSITIPREHPMSAYAAIVETVVGISDDPVEAATLGGEIPMGGVELSDDEIAAIPGAAEFFTGLHDAIFAKWQAAQNPLPPEPTE